MISEIPFCFAASLSADRQFRDVSLFPEMELGTTKVWKKKTSSEMSCNVYKLRSCISVYLTMLCQLQYEYDFGTDVREKHSRFLHYSWGMSH
jgi:hypothetical protein